jgi:hypothetical protein
MAFSVLDYVPASVKSAVARALDRSDDKTRAYQDMAVNAALFATAVWAIQRYGHKLAV